MSVFSVAENTIVAVATGKITFSQAETIFAGQIDKVTGATGSGAAVLTDLKQAASNVLGYADTLIAAPIAVGTAAVTLAANTALTAVVGPAVGAAWTPGLDASIVQTAATLKAAIDAEVLSFQTALKTPVVVVQPSQQLQPATVVVP